MVRFDAAGPVIMAGLFWRCDMKEKIETADKNNIWNKEDFAMVVIGEKGKLLAMLKHFLRCIKWSRQRVFRGYADCDIWAMDSYLQRLIPDMLQTLKDTRQPYSFFLTLPLFGILRISDYN